MEERSWYNIGSLGTKQWGLFERYLQRKVSNDFRLSWRLLMQEVYRDPERSETPLGTYFWLLSTNFTWLRHGKFVVLNLRLFLRVQVTCIPWDISAVYLSIDLYLSMSNSSLACMSWMTVIFFSCRGTDHKRGKLFLSTFRKDYSTLPSIRTLQFNIAITFLCWSQELWNLAQRKSI